MRLRGPYFQSPLPLPTIWLSCCCCWVAKSCPTCFGLQHTESLCPPISPRICLNSCLLSWWWYEGMHAWVLSHFSHVQLCVTLWTAARQAPLFMGFFFCGILQTRILEWVVCPLPRNLPDPRIEPTISYVYLHWQAGSLPLAPPGKPDAMSTRCQRIFSYLLTLSWNPHLSSSKSHISSGPQHPILTAITVEDVTYLRFYLTWKLIHSPATVLWILG